MMRPFLSLCMIVKDEEKVLARCLETVNDVVDEIIIVDTGSIDKTKEIAFKYTDLVFDYKWENDFSKARNYASSKASGEWIFVLDADEYVDETYFREFKQFLTDNEEKDILGVKIINFTGQHGEETGVNYHDRVYKNNGEISYCRSVHEVLKHNQSMGKRGIAPFEIFHSGYILDISKAKNKAERNLILLNKIKNKEAIDYFFLGNTYTALGDFDKAIHSYKIGYQLRDNKEYNWVPKLLVRLTNCLFFTNQNDEALDILNQCKKVYSQLVDFEYLTGKYCLDNGIDEEAIKIFEGILRNKDTLKADTSLDFLEYLPHKYLGELYEKTEQIHLAVHHYSKAISINDSDNYNWMRLINLLSQHSSLKEIEVFIYNNCLNRNTMNELRLVKILMSVPNINVQKISEVYLENSHLSIMEKEALNIKILFLNENNDKLIEKIENKNVNELKQLFTSGIFSIIDFIILILETDNKKYKDTLLELKFDKPINSLLSVLFGKNKKLSTFEEELFISIFKQANVLKKSKVLEYLKKKVKYLSIEGKMKNKKEMRKYKLI